MVKHHLNLDDSDDWSGLWWLPGDPDSKVPGVLRYDPETGLELSLIGTFEDRIMSHPSPGMTVFHEGQQTWDVIHGAADQREITLLDCVPRGARRTFGARVASPDKQTVSAAIAVIGAHVSGRDETAFSASQVSVEDLGLWAALPVFDGFIGAPGGQPDGSGSISVKPADDRVVKVGGTEFRLTHQITLPSFDERKGETVARMRDIKFLQVVPPAAFSLTDAMDATSLIQDLISLATHRASGVIWMRVELAETDPRPEEGGPAQRRRADVLYQPTVRGKRDGKGTDPHRVFFTCASLPFEDVVPRWCEARERLKAATNLILGLRYAPATYIESNLLTAAGAAEVLHRGLRIGKRPFPASDFKAMRDAMLAKAPEEHRDRLRKAIRNDPTLHDRLLDLAARPDQQAIALLMPDIGRWATRTTRARNDLAHEGRTPHHSVSELIAVVRVTTAVVILNLLQELGLPGEQQRSIVRDHPHLRMTARLAQELLVEPEVTT